MLSACRGPPHTCAPALAWRAFGAPRQLRITLSRSPHGHRGQRRRRAKARLALKRAKSALLGHHATRRDDPLLSMAKYFPSDAFGGAAAKAGKAGGGAWKGSPDAGRARFWKCQQVECAYRWNWATRTHCFGCSHARAQAQASPKKQRTADGGAAASDGEGGWTIVYKGKPISLATAPPATPAAGPADSDAGAKPVKPNDEGAPAKTEV